MVWMDRASFGEEPLIVFITIYCFLVFKFEFYFLQRYCAKFASLFAIRATLLQIYRYCGRVVKFFHRPESAENGARGKGSPPPPPRTLYGRTECRALKRRPKTDRKPKRTQTLFSTVLRLQMSLITRFFNACFFFKTAYPSINRHAWKRFRIMSNFHGDICT
jgi:hypothetical protein